MCPTVRTVTGWLSSARIMPVNLFPERRSRNACAATINTEAEPIVPKGAVKHRASHRISTRLQPCAIATKFRPKKEVTRRDPVTSPVVCGPVHAAEEKPPSGAVLQDGPGESSPGTAAPRKRHRIWPALRFLIHLTAARHG